MRFFKINLFFLLGSIVSLNSVGQGVQFVHKVYEYKPAPGQFINTAFGFPSAAQSIIGEMQGGVSLGAFGGSIVVGFDKPIENDSNNPYGIDFTIFGNANQSSTEPAVVYVMRDENANGMPDDIWYLLAGSDYWFSTSISDYEISYYNPGDTIAKDIKWEDNQGNTGAIPANDFHTQTYYPLSDSFPEIAADKYILTGAKVKDRLDLTMLDYVSSSPFPFGYADNLARNNNYSGWQPNNPYTKDIEGTGGDGFDINWAVDANGNYIELDKIDFIKIQTAVNALAGWLGEISTEVLGVVDVEPNNTVLGEDKLLIIEPTKQSITVGEVLKINAFAFKNGRLQSNEEVKWSSTNNDVAVINEFGVLDGLKEGYCYILVKLAGHEEIADSVKIKVYATTTASQEQFNDIKLYPNPVNAVLHISNNPGFTHCTIYNSFGKMVMKSNFYDNQIEFESMQSGLYFIELEGNSIKVCKKIIKN